MRLDRTFIGSYEFEVGEWPGGRCDRMFWYPGAATTGGRDGLVLSISPAEGRAWLGVFAPQGSSARGASGAVALPDQRTLAVLSNGTVYRVAADDPVQWEEPSVGGVTDPVIAEDLDLVLFVEYTTVLAYGCGGLAWHTEPLVWDDLQALRLEGDVLHLEGFDAPLNEIVPFSLDLRTGRSPDAPYPGRRVRRVN
ncbi:MAG: hypothetical protein JO363_17235 [Solirubrobacterales bacterium]|nr:hypothetical protein [Solirubrobacterales bacterium]